MVIFPYFVLVIAITIDDNDRVAGIEIGWEGKGGGGGDIFIFHSKNILLCSKCLVNEADVLSSRLSAIIMRQSASNTYFSNI
jgi:hypothetical protein